MTPTLDLAKRRYSCRRFIDQPLATAAKKTIDDLLASLSGGPLGSKCRFALVAATPGDGDALKGLGTYGFVRGATGFIIGTVRPAPKDLEDYGYCLEQAVLKATSLGLGTCWLGGSFTRSSFAARIAARENEVVPAVVAVGYPAGGSRSGLIRKGARSDSRLPPDRLFYDKTYATPLGIGEDAGLAELVEIVRWAPSASNKQPWRFVRVGEVWHLYLERTPGYDSGRLSSLIKKADLQRVDAGIAMCHFEMAARETGMRGHWAISAAAGAKTTPVRVAPAGADPTTETGAASWEYVASWVG